MASTPEQAPLPLLPRIRHNRLLRILHFSHGRVLPEKVRAAHGIFRQGLAPFSGCSEYRLAINAFLFTND
uniref:Uncharacterized protein n=1 Tax=Pristionchus pacificus TaxID=54126 RepID=A0A2A6CM28_PRIPA|eukprot:PDM79166.1 hypothetical protein PRIPAC_31745 [Pristionchus pacificus]